MTHWSPAEDTKSVLLLFLSWMKAGGAETATVHTWILFVIHHKKGGMSHDSVIKLRVALWGGGTPACVWQEICS